MAQLDNMHSFGVAVLKPPRNKLKRGPGQDSLALKDACDTKFKAMGFFFFPLLSNFEDGAGKTCATAGSPCKADLPMSSASWWHRC